jgi:hypothetical protein
MNSWNAGPGEMPYDAERQDDGTRDPICPECGEARHTPDCPYVQHVADKIQRAQPVKANRSAA